MTSRFVWFAYIDPGSGSFIFQVLIGGLLAGAVAVKTFWRRIASLFTRRGSRNEAAEKLD